MKGNNKFIREDTAVNYVRNDISFVPKKICIFLNWNLTKVTGKSRNVLLSLSVLITKKSFICILTLFAYYYIIRKRDLAYITLYLNCIRNGSIKVGLNTDFSVYLTIVQWLMDEMTLLLHKMYMLHLTLPRICARDICTPSSQKTSQD